MGGYTHISWGKQQNCLLTYHQAGLDQGHLRLSHHDSIHTPILHTGVPRAPRAVAQCYPCYQASNSTDSGQALSHHQVLPPFPPIHRQDVHTLRNAPPQGSHSLPLGFITFLLSFNVVMLPMTQSVLTVTKCELRRERFRGTLWPQQLSRILCRHIRMVSLIYLC